MVLARHIRRFSLFTCAESNCCHLALLLESHNSDVGPDVVENNGSIQETDGNHVDDRSLSKACNGRVESLEGVNHGAGANVPKLHCSLVASDQDFVEVCAGVDQGRDGEGRIEVDSGVELYLGRKKQTC